MRLINVASLEIEQYYGDKVPEYAILSHTWGNQEVTLQEWARRHEPGISTKSGYQKIISACKLAEANKYNHVWVDTNCIDKTSSAELSEAINSMFAWYLNAKACYVYLEDVLYDLGSGPNASYTCLFKSSRWFTRGWTLQELIAPDTVQFYDQHWTFIESKSRCRDALSKVTSIPQSVLASQQNLRKASTAQRFSWLSRRSTTRPEDMAYCMFGIFNVNLPLLYGEGDKAFTRLQEELMRSFHDHTIFCWSWPEQVPRPDWISALAPNAAAFADSGDYIRRPGSLIGTHPAEYTVTNVGIRMQVHLLPSSDLRCFALLDAYIDGTSWSNCLGIPLRRIEDTNRWDENMFWRAEDPNGPVTLPFDWAATRTQIRLARHSAHPEDHGYNYDTWTMHVGSNADKWPYAAQSSFAVLPLANLEEDMYIPPLDPRCRVKAGVVFLRATSSPTVWVWTFGHTLGCVEITVFAHIRGERVQWGLSLDSAPDTNVDQWAAQQFERTTLEQREESVITDLSRSLTIRIPQRLQVRKCTLGRLADVSLTPLFVSTVRSSSLRETISSLNSL